MKSIRFILPSLLLMAACAEPDLQMEISIDMNAEGRQVSDHLYGIFIEDINRAIDGRLYAEMVMNRSFEDAVVPKGYHTDGNTLISDTVSPMLSVRDIRSGRLPDWLRAMSRR